MDISYGNEPSLAYEYPPPYSPVRGAGEGNNGLWDEKKDDGIVVRIARTWTRTATFQEAPKKLARTTSDFLQQRTWPAIRDTTTTHVTPMIASAPRTTWSFVRDHVCRPIWNYPLKASQFWGLLLLLFGIIPFAIYGLIVGAPYGRFYYGAFAAKTLGCGDALGVPQNSTVVGIEALFVLDWTFGQFSFSRVKTIDVAWDIFVGRGVQMIFWAISYRVFSDALLRLIERHPASFETFKSISLEGPGLGSSCILLKQLFRNRGARTWFLFFYMLLASFYVLSIPPLLGAMSGYDSTAIAWVAVGNDDTIVPSSQIIQSYAILGVRNQTFEQPICDTTTMELRDFFYHKMDIEKYCDCKLPNGTVLPFQEWQYRYYSYNYNNEPNWVPPQGPYQYEDCKTHFDGQTGVYLSSWGQDSDYPRAKNWGEYACNDTFPVTLPDGQTYSIYDINYTASGYCFGNKTYKYWDLVDSTRCLPDTANPSYQWGFSSAMIGVCFIINLVWCLSMWVVWQDALRAKLVRRGYRMSPLRAAFILTEAARRRTGVNGVEGLVLRDRRLLRRELRRGKGRKEAVVDREVFEEGEGDDEVEYGKGNAITIKRRPVRTRSRDDVGV
ncbi:uncharacterized protein CC84DRAFT_1163997 [Paraphaeosphaeria sporulosa]|uniref:Uncharacterized protein n=1 Tax=Paraphaeosphaeria sporulosa TaxID=1460663 RepID=A0A177CCT2_9PLEO|nr:uncharacterized protein CC84DRAFT_1163997 [Paraphaeosphaeria sporulosa]OAG05464.1 hypothetical protein CC84DRAFT_1163997 [Paraphaeosphaeria sporulosa]